VQRRGWSIKGNANSRWKHSRHAGLRKRKMTPRNNRDSRLSITTCPMMTGRMSSRLGFQAGVLANWLLAAPERNNCIYDSNGERWKYCKAKKAV
jgi:hypothetical protein